MEGDKSIIHEDSSLSRDSSKRLEDTPKVNRFKTNSKLAPTTLESIGEKSKIKSSVRKKETNFDKSIKAEGQSIAPTIPVTAFSSQV